VVRTPESVPPFFLGAGVHVDPSATMDMQTVIAGNQASKSNNDVWGMITIGP
jgi:hypothetical protein